MDVVACYLFFVFCLLFWADFGLKARRLVVIVSIFGSGPL